MATADRIRVMALSASLGRGGAERVLSHLLNHLDRRRFEPELTIFAPPILYDLPSDVRVNVLSERDAHRAVRLRPVPDELARRFGAQIAAIEAAGSRVVDAVWERRPDVIITSPSWASLMVAAVAHALPIGTRLVHRVSAMPSAAVKDYPWADLFSYYIREYFPEAARVVAVSDGMARDLESSFGLRRSLIEVINNPVDVSSIELMGRQSIAPDRLVVDEPFVLYVGRLERVKGLEYLLTACADVQRRQPTRLVMIGEGSQRGYLMALAKHLGIDSSVHFLGQDENPFRFMAKASLLVLPSLSEGMSNVLVEAMASGCPIVATDVEGGITRQLLEGGRAGAIVPPGDADALARAMSELLENPVRREELGRQARARANAFDVRVVVDRYEELLAEVAERTKAAQPPKHNQTAPDREAEPPIVPVAAEHEADSGVQRPLSRGERLRKRAGSLVRRFVRPKSRPAVPLSAAADMKLLIVVPSLASLAPGTRLAALLGALPGRSVDSAVAVLFEDSDGDTGLDGARYYGLQSRDGDLGRSRALVADLGLASDESELAWLAASADKMARLYSEVEADAVLAHGWEVARLALLAKRVPSGPTTVIVEPLAPLSSVANGEAGPLEAALFAECGGDIDGLIVAQALVEDLQLVGVLAGVPKIHANEDLVDVGAALSRLGIGPHETANSNEGGCMFAAIDEPLAPLDCGTLAQAASIAAGKADVGVCVGVSANRRAAVDAALRAGLAPSTVRTMDLAECAGMIGSVAGVICSPAHACAGVPDAVAVALAFEIPVVVAGSLGDGWGLLEHDETALFVRPGDSLALSEAMLQLCWDAEVRERLASAGARRLSRRDASRLTADTVSFIREIAVRQRLTAEGA